MAVTRPDTPLWKRMLLRRLKFLGWLAALVALVLGASYAFKPAWLLDANTRREAMAAHLEQHAVQAGDTHWIYYEGGQGPTIVLLHGFGMDKSAWLPLAKELGGHFHLIIPDLPGWGDSSRQPGADYGIEAQAERFDRFVDTLGLQGFLLAGHSMGGAIAGIYATAHPEHVGALALLDTAGLAAPHASALERELAGGANPFLYTDRAGFAALLKLAFATPPRLPGRFQDVYIERNRRDLDFLRSTFARLQDDADRQILTPRLDRLAMPVLGLWCRNDRLVDVSTLDTLRNGLGTASAISTSIINDCGHLPMLERPAATARVLTGFALSH